MKQRANGDEAKQPSRVAEGSSRRSGSSGSSGSSRRSSKPNSVLATRIYELEPQPKPQQANDSRHQRKGHHCVVFFSCHGGTGATTLATTTAVMLARAKRSTCVLDLDLQFGDVLGAYDLRSASSISDLFSDWTQHHKELVLTRLPRHKSGVSVLSQVGCVEGLSELSHRKFPSFLQQVRKHFDFLVIDGVRDFNDYALAVIDIADTIVLVTTPEVPALRGLVMRLKIFKRLGFQIADLHVVVNRYARKNPMSMSAIVHATNVEPRYLISDDFGAVHRAFQTGQTLLESTSGARVTRDIQQMVQKLFTVQVPLEPPGLLQRLLGRSKR